MLTVFEFHSFMHKSSLVQKNYIFYICLVFIGLLFVYNCPYGIDTIINNLHDTNTYSQDNIQSV